MHFRQIARLSSLPLHLVAQLGRLLAEIFGLSAKTSAKV